MEYHLTVEAPQIATVLAEARDLRMETGMIDSMQAQHGLRVPEVAIRYYGPYILHINALILRVRSLLPSDIIVPVMYREQVVAIRTLVDALAQSAAIFHTWLYRRGLGLPHDAPDDDSPGDVLLAA